MKPENPAETDCLASPEPPDPQATPASAHLERKVSQDFQGLRVAPAALASPALATPGRPAFAESLESPVYLGCLGNQVYPDREAKCYLAPYLVREETPVSPVYPDDQVLKVSQVSQEALDVQGLTVPKEREETLVLEANLDHKAFRDPEGILDFQVYHHRALMEPGGRMALQGVPEPRASLEMYWEPHLVAQDRTVCQESLETRASPGRQEDLDHLAVMGVSVFLD